MITFNEYIKISNNPLRYNILEEGGASGHMQHPFDLPKVKTGRDLIQFFEDAAEILSEGDASLKIDGINTSFKLIKRLDGEREFALDRGSMKPIDVEGITIDRLIERFGEGHGMVHAGETLLKILNQSLPIISKELKELGMWYNSNVFLNTEFVAKKTNVQEYDHNFLAIHGVNEFYQVTPKRRASKEISYKKSSMMSLIEKLNTVAGTYDYKVYGSIPVTLKLDSLPNYQYILKQQTAFMYDDNTLENKTLETWLINAKNPVGTMVNTLDGKKIGALSKNVYLHILEGKPASDIVGDDRDLQQLCIDGAIIYHATRLLGAELLRHLESDMGSANDHEGIVIRDKKFGNNPVKVTGEFIVSGMNSSFRSNNENESSAVQNFNKGINSDFFVNNPGHIGGFGLPG